MRFKNFDQAVDVSDARSLATFITLAREELRAPAGLTDRSLAPPSALGIGPLVRQSSVQRIDAAEGGGGAAGGAVTAVAAPIEPSPYAAPLRSALTPGLAFCTRLATVANALEQRLTGVLERGGEGAEAEA